MDFYYVSALNIIWLLNLVQIVITYPKDYSITRTRHGHGRKIFFILEQNAQNNFCRGENSKIPIEMTLFWLGDHRPTYRPFSVKKMKT